MEIVDDIAHLSGREQRLFAAEARQVLAAEIDYAAALAGLALREEALLQKVRVANTLGAAFGMLDGVVLNWDRRIVEHAVRQLGDAGLLDVDEVLGVPPEDDQTSHWLL